LGVLLTPILRREETSLEALKGRSFAVDASIELHRFLALVRKPDGTLFTDKSGRVTSHLIGLLSWASKLITEYRMSTVFVFDGPPNPLKRRTLDERRAARKKAEDEYSRAAASGDYSLAWSKAVMTGRVTGEILDDAKRLLTSMGVPWLDAPEDAEAQASYMAEKGDVWAAASKDYDSLLYGTPILARYLSISGQEFLPAQHRMRRLIPELVRLAENLRHLGINRQQLVDLAILVGTDFNEGVRGVGPKRALALIKKYGSLEEIPTEVKSQLPSEVGQIRQIFLHPKVMNSYQLKTSRPKPEALHRFLVEERDFSSQRVTHVAEKLLRTYESRDAGLTKWLN
jgi:flap endonuclease-1